MITVVTVSKILVILMHNKGGTTAGIGEEAISDFATCPRASKDLNGVGIEPGTFRSRANTFTITL